MTRIPEIFPNLCPGWPSAAEPPVLLLLSLPVVLPADSGWWHTLPDYHSRMWFRGNQTSDLPPRGMLVFRRNFRGRLFSRSRRCLRGGMFRHDEPGGGLDSARADRLPVGAGHFAAACRPAAGTEPPTEKEPPTETAHFPGCRASGFFGRTAAIRSRIRRATETERSR